MAWLPLPLQRGTSPLHSPSFSPTHQQRGAADPFSTGNVAMTAMELAVGITKWN